MVWYIRWSKDQSSGSVLSYYTNFVEFQGAKFFLREFIGGEGEGDVGFLVDEANGLCFL